MCACTHERIHACLRLHARVCGCMHGEHSPCAELARATRACTYACTCVCAWMHACVSLEHPPWEELTMWGKADWPPDELQRVDCRRRWTLPERTLGENCRWNLVETAGNQGSSKADNAKQSSRQTRSKLQSSLTCHPGRPRGNTGIA